MWRFLAIGLPFILAACSLSGQVEQSSVDYNRAIEDVTNQLIVTNVLRARDHAPLHFTDLSNIHGSLQLNTYASSVLPVGSVTKPTVRPRDLITVGAAVTSSPAFDTAPLNSSGFTDGLLSPLPLKYLRYYLQRGVSQSLLLNLLVEKVSFVQNGPPPIICEYPSTAIPLNPVANATSSPCPPPGYSKVHDFQSLIASWTKPVIFNDYDQLSPFGPPIAVKPETAVRDLATAGNGSLILKSIKGGRYQFYKTKSRTAVCIPAPASEGEEHQDYVATTVVGDGTATPETGELPDSCFRRQVEGADDTDQQSRGKRPQITMYLRSVKSVIEYLGEIERLPNNVPRPIAFYIHPGLDLGARINVSYDDGHYHVNDFQDGTDETIQVLSIVNDLLNLIKKANEIPNTPSVQVLQ